MRILLVEDEPDLALAILAGLRAEGYAVVISRDGLDGFHNARTGDFDVIVLDLMLPHMSGFAVTQRLRAEGVDTPILVLTAKAGADDQTEALDTGADDYLSKPFAFQVLLARLRALSRRAPTRSQAISVGDLTVNIASRRVYRGETRVDLSPTEFRLLELLVRRPYEPLSKDVLMAEAWPDGAPSLNGLEARIAGLRRRIDTPFGVNTVQTIRGKGYRIVAPQAWLPDD